MIIEDGAGTGYKVKVNEKNRAKVQASISTQLHDASIEDEVAYDFSSGDFVSITTTDTETGVFYLKNTSTTLKLIINSLRTCSDAVHKVKMYKNPTGGTLISAAVAGSSTNMNFTSSKVADAIVYTGDEGRTLTGGTVVTQHINNVGHSTDHFENALIIGPGESIALTFSLASAGDCCVRITAYYE